MFERYSEEARRTLFFARYEAHQRGFLAIEPEHLVLGMLRDNGVVSRLLEAAGVSLLTLHERLTAGLSSEHTSSASEIPFSPATKRALMSAAQEADLLNHHAIEPQHLLLGVLRDESSTAAAVVRDLGAGLDAMRHAVGQLASKEFEAREVPSPRTRPARPPRPTTTRSYEVHIAPASSADAGTQSSTGPGWWVRRGFELKPLLAEVSGIEELRIDLPADLETDERLDVIVSLPRVETVQTVHWLVERALAERFELVVTRAIEPRDVIVVTAPVGVNASTGSGGGGFAFRFRDVVVPEGIMPAGAFRHLARGPFAGGSIGVSCRGTVDDFCRALSHQLGAIVVDETGLVDSYNLEFRCDGRDAEDVFSALRNQLGLVATRARRDLPVLLVTRRPA